MQVAFEESEVDLSLLAKRLVVTGMPVQAVIASEAGVSQSTVSRAIHQRIRGASRGAQQLWRYTTTRLEVLEVAPAREAETPPLDMRAQSPEQRRAARIPRRRSVAAEHALPGNRDKLAQVAVDGLRRYLEDAFDPELVIEQLAVLRRAQDRGRRGS